MEKLLIINASPRENGVNAEVIKQVKPEFADCEIKQYDVYKLSPAPCIACNYCEMHDGCSNHDLDIFFEDFEDADYIAFFSPIYNNFFPAPLKAIIDRFQRYYSACFCRGANPPIEKPKKVGLVVTSGSSGRQSRQNADFMFNTLKDCFKVLNGDVRARYYIPGTDSKQYTFNVTELEKFVHQLRR